MGGFASMSLAYYNSLEEMPFNARRRIILYDAMEEIEMGKAILKGALEGAKTLKNSSIFNPQERALQKLVEVRGKSPWSL